jgi:RHS repeat-associated protein
VQRRTQATLADGSRWHYAYNDRDEVVAGKRTWVDWTPVAGQQFEYAYDNIGNRLSAMTGGNEAGSALRSLAYTANALNQYTAITNPPYASIIGAALATNAVTVCGSTNGVSRRGEYFHREITVTNASGPVWTGVTVSSGGGSTNGGLASPGAQQSLSYDEDGNLTGDGIWAYRWDGENRLVEMTMTNIGYVPASQRKKLEFVYDFMGRRVQKVVSAWNGSAFTNGPTTKFVYDGWNLLATLNSQLSTLNLFLWGQDLSGMMQGAGGIGGLVAVFEICNGQISNAHYPCYDGNGNVMALVQTDGTASAHYEYGPFGEPIKVTGPAAGLNPFRWSTKFADDESGLVYYGYRYYSPTLGRWISGDPIHEDGGINLYAFAANSPKNLFDPSGAANYAFDSFGFHIRDGDQTYIPVFNEDGSWDVAPKGNHPLDREKAMSSLNRILTDENEFMNMKRFHAGATYENTGKVIWDEFPSMRDTIRAQGSNMWRAAKTAQRLLGVLAIYAAVSSSVEAAAAAQEYARFSSQGEIAMRDLADVDVAINIQDAAGNYFFTYLALDILLGD